MANYRDEAPKSLKELTSDGILKFFEDERATEEDILWIREILTNEEYKTYKNPISQWRWGKIKTAFATKYFPNIAPASKSNTGTIDDRIFDLLGF